MAKPSNLSVFSPAAGDLGSMPSPGGGSLPSALSVFPDISMTDKSGDAAPGSKAAENFGMMSETVSLGGASGVQLADAPESPSADLGNQLAGGLGDAPKPSGSY